MNLYDSNGYLNFGEVLRNSLTFNWIVGGRGTGKTFSGLKYIYENDLRFIYLRAGKTQIEKVATPLFNPFKPLNDLYGYNVSVDTVVKDIPGFYRDTEDSKELIGIACALSSFSNLRGFSAMDFDVIIFDEFIPKEGEIVRGNWGLQFIDFFETVNRNRELEGRRPVKVFGFANSNKIGNHIFIHFNLLNKSIEMIRKKQNFSRMTEKDTCLFFLSDSPISKKKAETSLYKAIGDDYKEMALDNAFEGVDEEGVKSLPIKQLRPVVQVAELYVYEWDSGYYFSNKGFMKMRKVNFETFKSYYRDIIASILFGRCLYENITSKIIANEYFN